MSFVERSIDYITHIYGNYFESNAKITMNNYEEKASQNLYIHSTETDFENKNENENENINYFEDQMIIDTATNDDKLPQTPQTSHSYNTRSKNKSTKKNEKKKPEELFIDTSSPYGKNKNTKSERLHTSPVSLSSSSCASPEERIMHLETTIKGLEKSLNNSKTAKGGYIEEEKVLLDLNAPSGLSTLFVNKFLPSILKKDAKQFAKFKRHPNSVCKTDIINIDQNILIQIKRYDVKCCYGQIDRHWVDNFIQEIPEIKPVSYMLRNLCEIPLISGTNMVDKEIGRIPLSLEYYSDIQLKSLLDTLNNNIVKILHFVLLGSECATSPNYLMGIEYNKEDRVKTTIYKMKDVIHELSRQFKFRIKSSSTVITLGDIISIQRKGGDNGLRASNQLQWKIRFSALQTIIPSSKYLEYFF